MGRISTYSKETADAICVRLINGDSLNAICRDESFPCKPAVLRWLHEQDDFRTQYARAKEVCMEAMAEDILDIADDGSNDWMDKRSGETEARVPDIEVLQRSKLRVDTRKWLMSKLAPKKYGDKMQTEVTGKLTLESLILASQDAPGAIADEPDDQ